MEFSRLRYHERTEGKFRDLRSAEQKLPRRRFIRLSINGQYRNSKERNATTRYANPGWAFGTNWIFVEWVHFRRHCWHLSFNFYRRGITLSYGKRII